MHPSLRSPTPQAADAVVIGAGPVGLFQVFQLGLQGIAAHLVDALPHVGGQCAELYPDKPIYDIPGIPVCTGQGLVELLQRQIAPFSPTLHLGQQVHTLAAQADGRILLTTTAGTALLARSVFIAAGVGAFAAAAGIQPILQLPAIADYSEKMMAVKEPGSVPIFSTEGAGNRAVTWSPTGSTWLDQFGNTVIIEADPGDQQQATIAISLLSGEEPISTPGPVPNSIMARVIPDVSYKLHVSGPEKASIKVSSKGALQPMNATETLPDDQR